MTIIVRINSVTDPNHEEVTRYLSAPIMKFAAVNHIDRKQMLLSSFVSALDKLGEESKLMHDFCIVFDVTEED
jgi:hypothetical protein